MVLRWEGSAARKTDLAKQYLVLGFLQAGRKLLESLPASLGLKFSFVDLEAGFETFKQTGTALPEKTVKVLQRECDGALFGAVRYLAF
ncbi:hypothetical protein GP486_006471 [Trichoglossum hirsutum]|uniref:Uncharacterized protein n=1 Tax=Trichoglossum hirsutum TaxID=265104 RepID=A0A9P8IDM3_9PEZI|nr:hypothetical protein GP486_006471 [Trichoglossum hirsutum]